MQLAVETSGPQGGLALLKNDTLVDTVEWKRQNRSPKGEKKPASHSELITVKLQELLDQNSTTLKDLESLIVSIGPGSFTGIRVGLNFAKSLAYALNLPVYAYDSLAALAHEKYSDKQSKSDDPQTICCMINAFKNMVYTATYRVDSGQATCLAEPQVIEVEKLNPKNLQLSPEGKTILLGDALQVYGDMIPSSVKGQLVEGPETLAATTIHGLVKCHFARPSSTQTICWNELRPLYLRPSSAEENREKGLLKSL